MSDEPAAGGEAGEQRELLALGVDSSNSGTPTSMEPIGARERRRAERRERQVSERELQ